MDPIIIVLIVLGVILVLGIALWIAARGRRERLQERFGPEYDRAVGQAGSPRKADSELAARERRREKLDIRPLDPARREAFAARWQTVQARFVDDPRGAVGQADQLVGEVMRERGYPVEDFEQREADLSVEHAEVMDKYRAAHGISMAADQGQATTEDLRQATVHYRALFDRLLGTGDRAPDVTST